MTAVRTLVRILLFAAALPLAACAPRVAEPGPAIMAPGLTADTFAAADGERLPLRRWWPERRPPSGVILALHGFNDYGHFIADAAEAFSTAGLAVYAPDQRGFGEAPNRGLWAGADAMADDVTTLARLLRHRHPGIPFYVLGESMGAAVALLALASPNTPRPDGVILVAPAVWSRETMPGYQRVALLLAAHTVPWLRLTGQGLNIIASDNVEALRALSRDPLVIKHTRVDAIWGLANLMDRAFAAADGVSMPTLVLYGANDRVIPPRPVHRFIAALARDGDDDRKIAFYPSGYHLLLRDLKADIAIDDILAWIRQPRAVLPSGADKNAQERIAEAARPKT